METSASGARMKKPASRKTGSKRVLSASRSVHTLWASMSGAGERLPWMIRDSLHTEGLRWRISILAEVEMFPTGEPVPEPIYEDGRAGVGYDGCASWREVTMMRLVGRWKLKDHG